MAATCATRRSLARRPGQATRRRRRTRSRTSREPAGCDAAPARTACRRCGRARAHGHPGRRRVRPTREEPSTAKKTARAQAAAAQSIAELSRDPEESLRDALEAVDATARRARGDLRAATRGLVSRMDLDVPSRGVGRRGTRLLDVEFSEDDVASATAPARMAESRSGTCVGRPGQRLHHRRRGPPSSSVGRPTGAGGISETRGGLGELRENGRRSSTPAPTTRMAATWGAGGRRILTVSSRGGEVWDAASGDSIRQLPGAGGSAGVRISLDGRRTHRRQDRTPRLWNIRAGNERHASRHERCPSTRVLPLRRRCEALRDFLPRRCIASGLRGDETRGSASRRRISDVDLSATGGASFGPTEMTSSRSLGHGLGVRKPKAMARLIRVGR